MHYVATSWYFFLVGAIMGTWISRLTDVRTSNDLSYTLLGIVLIFGAFGAIVALPIVAGVNERLGSASSLLVGSLWMTFSVPPIGIDNVGLEGLLPAMVSVGFGIALSDVSMTAQAVVVEKKLGRNTMGYCDAMNSVGGFIGAIAGGLLAHYNYTPLIHFILVTIVTTPVSVAAYFFLIGKDEEQNLVREAPVVGANRRIEDEENGCDFNGPQYGENANFIAKTAGTDDSPLPPESRWYIAYLSSIGFLAELGIGTISDWSTVYFRETLGASALIGACAYAVFSLSMAVGGFLSDAASARMSRLVLLRNSGCGGALGLGITVLAPSLAGAATAQSAVIPIAIAGMIISGLAISFTMPVVSSSTGDIPGVKPSNAIAVVTSISYLGALLGPPFFGGMADVLQNLRYSLLIAVGLVASIAVIPGSPPQNKYQRLLADTDDEGEEKEEEERRESCLPAVIANNSKIAESGADDSNDSLSGGNISSGRQLHDIERELDAPLLDSYN